MGKCSSCDKTLHFNSTSAAGCSHVLKKHTNVTHIWWPYLTRHGGSRGIPKYKYCAVKGKNSNTKNTTTGSELRKIENNDNPTSSKLPQTRTISSTTAEQLLFHSQSGNPGAEDTTGAKNESVGEIILEPKTTKKIVPTAPCATQVKL